MPTRKLFYEDPHLAEFTARVLRCTETDKGFEITLDATAFYPEGGGQAADTGTLGAAHVLDTRERGEEIVHLCDAPLKAGTEVKGQIDWMPRFLRMQQHSGEHIISGILHRRYGVSNTGFHMGQERTVIDFDGVIPPEALPEIEREANEAIWRNLPIRCYYPSEETLPTIPYRSKKALDWPVRIVEVPGYDICACCGIHVSATGEIGIIKLFSAVPFRGGTRMEMACGAQAYDYLNRVMQEAGEVSHLFSAPADKIGEAARLFAAQLTGYKGRVVELQRRLFARCAEDHRGKGNILHLEPGLDSTGLRELADRIAETCGGTVAVFSGTEGNMGYCLADRANDLRPLGKEMTARLNGRGGGKPNFQQGSVKANQEEILAFFREQGWNC